MSETTAAGHASSNGAGTAAQSADVVARLTNAIKDELARRIPRADLDERDPDYIRESLPGLWLLATLWFRAEVRGLENIPEDGAVLLVGNHSGGNMTPDTTVFTLAFNTYFGVERRFFQLAHNLVLAMPGLALPAQVRHGGGVAGERRQGALVGRRAARLPGRRLRGAPAVVGVAQGRLRRPQGLHPPGALEGRADRAGGVDRRPGDRAVPRAAASGWRSSCGSTSCSASRCCRSRWRCRGASTSATCSATSRCPRRSRSRCCRRSTCAGSSAADPDLDEVYDEVIAAHAARPSTRSRTSGGFPVIG